MVLINVLEEKKVYQVDESCLAKIVAVLAWVLRFG
jgi:hypothetical protein